MSTTDARGGGTAAREPLRMRGGVGGSRLGGFSGLLLRPVRRSCGQHAHRGALVAGGTAGSRLA